MHYRFVLFTATVCLAGQAYAHASEMPAHRPGLWQLTMRMFAPNAREFTVKRCADRETDILAHSFAIGWTEEACAKRDVRREGAKLVVDSTCKVGSSEVNSHTEISGSFDDAYTMKIVGRREGGGMAPENHELIIEANWLGPCAAGQKPGDIILPGGMTMNIRNIRGMFGGDAAK